MLKTNNSTLRARTYAAPQGTRRPLGDAAAAYSFLSWRSCESLIFEGAKISSVDTAFLNEQKGTAAKHYNLAPTHHKKERNPSNKLYTLCPCLIPPHCIGPVGMKQQIANPKAQVGGSLFITCQTSLTKIITHLKHLFFPTVENRNIFFLLIINHPYSSTGCGGI